MEFNAYNRSIDIIKTINDLWTKFNTNFISDSPCTFHLRTQSMSSMFKTTNHLKFSIIIKLLTS